MIRGWKDDPLDKEGRFEAQIFAYKLKPYNPKTIYHSDFMRDTETAHIYAEKLGITDLNPDYDIRTWDTGDLSGKPEEEAEPIIADIYDNPWKTAPGGRESLNAFASRWWNLLEEILHMAGKLDEYRPPLIVTHGRNVATAYSYINGLTMKEGKMPEAGGFAVISVEPDTSLNIEIKGTAENILRDI